MLVPESAHLPRDGLSQDGADGTHPCLKQSANASSGVLVCGALLAGQRVGQAVSNTERPPAHACSVLLA